jgi:hypothetical protein
MSCTLVCGTVFCGFICCLKGKPTAGGGPADWAPLDEPAAYEPGTGARRAGFLTRCTSWWNSVWICIWNRDRAGLVLCHVWVVVCRCGKGCGLQPSGLAELCCKLCRRWQCAELLRRSNKGRHGQANAVQQEMRLRNSRALSFVTVRQFTEQLVVQNIHLLLLHCCPSSSPPSRLCPPDVSCDPNIYWLACSAMADSFAAFRLLFSPCLPFCLPSVLALYHVQSIATHLPLGKPEI